MLFRSSSAVAGSSLGGANCVHASGIAGSASAEAAASVGGLRVWAKANNDRAGELVAGELAGDEVPRLVAPAPFAAFVVFRTCWTHCWIFEGGVSSPWAVSPVRRFFNLFVRLMVKTSVLVFCVSAFFLIF